MTPLLEVKDLSKHFGGVAALDRCSLSLAKGEVTGLIGPNGAGKTTLLNAVSGLVKPDSGSVLFNGRDVIALPMHRVAALGLLRTFQIVRELSGLTVLENLLLAPPHQRGEAINGALFGRSTVQGQERHNAVKARAILKRIGLWKLADDWPRRCQAGRRSFWSLGARSCLSPRWYCSTSPRPASLRRC